MSSTFRIQRSAAIQAPPAKIFSVLEDFRQWGAWSPWENKDPGMQRRFGSIASGKGATYAWEGNRNVGSGSMEITEAVAASLLRLKLDFEKPFKARNTVEFSLQPQGAGTLVTWVMEGPQTFIGRVMGLFMDMDKMVGRDFEAGLANLKAITEK